MQIITGIFRAPEDVERAIDRLMDLGYAEDEINIMMSEEAREHKYSFKETKSRVAKGTAIGGGLGAVLGGLAVLAGAPGIVVAGPLATTLVAAGMGATTGGLINLSDRSIPEKDAELLKREITANSVLVIVESAEKPAEELATLFQNCGAHRTFVH